MRRTAFPMLRMPVSSFTIPHMQSRSRSAAAPFCESALRTSLILLRRKRNMANGACALGPPVEQTFDVEHMVAFPRPHAVVRSNHLVAAHALLRALVSKDFHIAKLFQIGLHLLEPSLLSILAEHRGACRPLRLAWHAPLPFRLEYSPQRRASLAASSIR